MALASLTGLVLVGCGHKQTDATAEAGDGSLSPAADGQLQQVSAEPIVPATNGEPAISDGFAQKLQDSPFASADPALKESYARALIAYEIGDYARAAQELGDLGNMAGLTAEQSQAIQNLWAKTKSSAPELVASNAAIAVASDAPTTYALAAATDAPFSTADPAVSESYARAKAAFDIGDYPKAAAELKELVENTQLNSAQKYAAELLLSKTPQPVGGSPTMNLRKAGN